jgi:hypothetical protein
MTHKTGIPNPRAANALSVADGTVTVGTVVENDGSFFSFNRDGELIGEYATQRQAMRSIPASKGATPIPAERGNHRRHGRQTA